MDRRNDYKTALLIDAIVNGAPEGGKPVPRTGVARELAAVGVPLEVAVRLLTRPGERRHPANAGDRPVD
jgi:hypothetical protein